MDSCKSRLEVNPANIFYVVKNDSNLSVSSDKSAITLQNIANSASGAAERDGKQMRGVEALLEAVGATFAGYRTEVAECLGVASLGLDCAHLFADTALPLSALPLQGSVSHTAAELMRPPKGLILHGPPGSGKSSLMRGIVTALGCNYVELSHNVLLSR